MFIVSFTTRLHLSPNVNIENISKADREYFFLLGDSVEVCM